VGGVNLEECLPRVLEESPDAVIITGLDGKVVFWNRGAEELLGYPREEALGRHIRELGIMETGDHGMWSRALEEAEPPRGLRAMLRTRGGAPVEALISIFTLRDREGEPVGVMGVARELGGPGDVREVRELRGIYEISDLFREEVKLDQVSGLLGEKIARLMDVERCTVVLYDTSAMEFHPLLPAYGVEDEDLRSMHFSLTDASLPLEEWPGTRPLVSNNPRRDRRLLGVFYREGDRNLLLAKLLVSGEFLGILRLANKHGGGFTPEDARLAEIIASRLGAAFHTMALFSELKEHARRLEEKNREVESFVYAISHDLKAPLISVQGYASALLSEYGSLLNEEARFYAERIKKNTELMDALISDLLELSRVGRITQPIEEIDLKGLLRDLKQEFTYKYEGLQLKVGDLPKVKGEKNRIMQVFSNLVDNAAKYMGDQKEPLVEVGCEPRGREWRFYVRDNGQGIAPEYLDKVFQPFYRGSQEALGGVEGTGLGLAIVKKIVEYHGGRIWAESRPGEGATFYFTLPR
jgi:PAS domain S-box-containing protein